MTSLCSGLGDVWFEKGTILALEFVLGIGSYCVFFCVYRNDTESKILVQGMSNSSAKAMFTCSRTHYPSLVYCDTHLPGYPLKTYTTLTLSIVKNKQTPNTIVSSCNKLPSPRLMRVHPTIREIHFSQPIFPPSSSHNFLRQLPLHPQRSS